MQILKKTTLSAISLVCMTLIVGYINYEYNEDREKNLGKTVYVSTSGGEVIKLEGSSYVFSDSKVDIDIISGNISLIKEKIEGITEKVLINYDFSSNTYNVFIKEKVSEVAELICKLKEEYQININIFNVE